MTNRTVLITNMVILVAIFLLGFLAKIFPKAGVAPARSNEQGSDFRRQTKPRG